MTQVGERIVHQRRGIFQRLTDIFLFQLRILKEKIRAIGVSCNHIQDSANRDAHAADARLSAALSRLDGNPIEVLHS